ncbi:MULTISPECIES: ATP-dependent DNA helicase [unclassified Thioalkalivibrio]|uniref:ATP-dependent DNA helicase n=1 Tax=unclassified Thioalkalivibrio TaxID=2621013 RepID=UPI000363300D|nr:MULTISPECIES: ATP-dependent DNA helicase [unclassified Thioalkalivibrio]
MSDAFSTVAAGSAAVRALSPGGDLATAVEGFRPREPQQRMAVAVEEALATAPTALLVEAATGVGKTFAYLVPILQSRRRALISTGTKTLQDQLFERDLPMVCEALGYRPRAALLKGRANYLCHYRLELAAAEAGGATGGGVRRDQLPVIEALQRFARSSDTGDLGQAGILAEDSMLWPQVTSTVDNCLGGECPNYNDCFVVQARKRAQEADVVVVNHHLLLADMALKEEGFGELLPEVDAVIVDEAHQLPDIAGSFFGIAVGTRALRELARDARREQEQHAPEMLDIRQRVAELEASVAELLDASRTWEGRSSWDTVNPDGALDPLLDRLDAALGFVGDALEAAAPRAPGLEQLRARSALLLERLREWRQETPDTVAWAERFSQSLTLHRTPLDAARPLAQRRAARPAAWIFTSATLAVGEDFGHAARRLGLPADVASERLDSPFDFPHQACLVHPQPPLPNPNDPGYTRACIAWAWPLLRDNPGGGFFLFTSHRALQEAATILRAELPDDRELLVQGEQPRGDLLARFRESGRAWLLGAHSFWEGVDIRGEALSVVIIDRLPFAAPNDPVLQARASALEAEGRSPFMEFTLPQAVLALKQGAGRLIRDADDAGILALCDPRLTGKSYGRRFLASLPPFHRTREPAAALRFLGKH